MKIIIKENYQQVSETTADIVAKLLREKPDLTFCLPAGSSPLGMYARLIEMFKQGLVDFSRMIAFNMDEYLGLPVEHENSFAYFTAYNFLNHVNVRQENIYRPDALTTDVEAECRRYSELIVAKGGLDIAITGLGDNGHVAFNEPADYLSARMHCVNLDEATIKANSRFFDDDVSKVPTRAVSIGMEEIMKSRTFLVIASGAHKAPILQKLFADQRITTRFPASFMRLHPNVIFILDKDAAAAIPSEVTEYYG